MAEDEIGRLSRYIRRIMELKGLSPRDVAERSGNRITTGYVSSLMKGRAANPSVTKLQALARGLGVGVEELLAVACGLDEASTELSSFDPTHTLMILDLMRQVVMDGEIEEMLRKIVRLSAEHRVIVSKYLNALDEEEEVELRLKKES